MEILHHKSIRTHLKDISLYIKEVYSHLLLIVYNRDRKAGVSYVTFLTSFFRTAASSANIFLPFMPKTYILYIYEIVLIYPNRIAVVFDSTA
jgi:hypothetical protein